MGLVSRVGRKTWRARLAMGFLYLLLGLGAVTTLYPFLVMLSTALKGPTDQNDASLMPRYFGEMDSKNDAGSLAPESLLGKYLADKYAGDAAMIGSTRIGADADPQGYEEFLMSLPVDWWTPGFKTPANQVTSRLAVRYQGWLRDRYGTIERLNRAYIDENTAFQTVAPPTEMLERASWQIPSTRKYREWREFKETLPAEFRLPIREQRLYQEFLRSQFANQIALAPSEVSAGATTFEAVPLVRKGALYEQFAATALPERYRGDTVEARWERQHAGPLPIEAFERAWVSQRQAEIRNEFATRNFRYVIDYVALNGRALWNTLLFVGLAVLTQLIVNPLAAYALSRYTMPATGKILLFLLATMAFPAEVAMIPSFLLLKDLGLLNTFAALVLPSAASGYMIFLLKGFFDSLPREVFESGQIDGAHERTLMLRLAMPMSRPVLGYLALLAFMHAYGAFLYAFLVAQDQRMWTLMVWIYQLQGSAPKAVILAALTLAALPTLLVFLLAQGFILRGIVLPEEK